MSRSVPNQTGSAPRELPEIRPSAMAKATLRKAENGRVVTGRALQRAAELAGVPRLDQLAALFPAPDGSERRDPRQVARWLDGNERVPIDLVWDIDALRLPLIQALAESLEEDVIEIRTQITLKQKVG